LFFSFCLHGFFYPKTGRISVLAANLKALILRITKIIIANLLVEMDNIMRSCSIEFLNQEFEFYFDN
jgi:predicted DNA-binding transcriptional regulator